MLELHLGKPVCFLVSVVLLVGGISWPSGVHGFPSTLRSRGSRLLEKLH